MKAACQHGATQVARAANFARGAISLFYFSRRETFVAPFPKVHVITRLFHDAALASAGLQWRLSLTVAAHLRLFSVAHTSQEPKREIRHN